MNEYALIAVVLVCLTALAWHAINRFHQRQQRADLVKERQEDDRLERVSQRLHAERMAQAEKLHTALLTRHDMAHDIYAMVREEADRAGAAAVDVKAIVAALDTNFAAIESRLVNIETGLGWSKRV